jgi:hypothetical protein
LTWYDLVTTWYRDNPGPLRVSKHHKNKHVQNHLPNVTHVHRIQTVTQRRGNGLSHFPIPEVRMSQVLSRLKSLWVATESTFSEREDLPDPKYTSSTTEGNFHWRRVPAEDIKFEATQEYLERNVQLDTLGRVPGVIGAKGGTLSFKVGLYGYDEDLFTPYWAIHTLMEGSSLKRSAAPKSVSSLQTTTGWDATHFTLTGASTECKKGDIIALKYGNQFQLKRVVSVSGLTGPTATSVEYSPPTTNDERTAITAEGSGITVLLPSQYTLNNPMGGVSGFGSVSFILHGAAKYEMLCCRVCSAQADDFSQGTSNARVFLPGE